MNAAIWWVMVAVVLFTWVAGVLFALWVLINVKNYHQTTERSEG